MTTKPDPDSLDYVFSQAKARGEQWTLQDVRDLIARLKSERDIARAELAGLKAGFSSPQSALCLSCNGQGAFGPRNAPTRQLCWICNGSGRVYPGGLRFSSGT